MTSVHLSPKRFGRGLLLLAAVLALLGSTAQPAQTQTLTTLYSFTGPPDGVSPNAGLVMDAQGNLYGTTEYGGAFPSCGQHRGCGTVFKLTPSGTETVLHSFSGQPSDGSFPLGGLVQDLLGNLYGTTSKGGAYKGAKYGTVFKVTPTGMESVLYSFSGSPDGEKPYAGLVLDGQGNLYGTTYHGGHPSKACHPHTHRCGTVFELTSTGTETVLYSFSGFPDGAFPVAGLTMDTRGNLYGTTPSGGAHRWGTVFKLTPAAEETVLHSFGGSQSGDGARPYAGLTIDAQGNLYGTTQDGGSSGCGGFGCGTVFEVTASGVEKVLYIFASQPGDGTFPSVGLVMDARGNLYGTTFVGGTYGGGTVFRLTPNGAETVLYSFCSMSGCPDGAYPTGDLLMDAQGNLYGTTVFGGAFGNGTVFKLSYDHGRTAQGSKRTN